jgi:DHA1 family inner membrane transport protein
VRNSLKLQVLVFIVIRIIMNTSVRMVYPFLPVIGRGLGVDIGMLSRSIMLRSASGVFGPFLATIADTRGRKTGMVMGLLLFTLGMALMLVQPSFVTFTMMLIFSVLGIFAFLPSMQAYLGDKVPYDRRGLVLALTEFSWSLAFILGIPLVGFLIVRGSWLAPFPFFTITGGIAVAVIAWMLPGDKPAGDGSRQMWKNLGNVFTFTPALAGIAMGLTFSVANELVNLMFGVWLEGNFGVQISALAAASVVIGVSELAGEGLVGGTTDRIGKRRSVAIGLIFNCIVAAFIPFLGSSLVGALVGLFFFYLTFEYTIVSAIPLMTEIMPAVRATMMAAFISSTSIGRAVGDWIAPSLYQFGIDFHGLSGIMAIAAGVLFFNALAGACLMVLNVKLKGDLALNNL